MKTSSIALFLALSAGYLGVATAEPMANQGQITAKDTRTSRDKANHTPVTPGQSAVPAKPAHAKR